MKDGECYWTDVQMQRRKVETDLYRATVTNDSTCIE